MLNNLLNKNMLNEEEAAEYLGLSRSSLRQGRMKDRNPLRCPCPPFYRIGRAIRYKRTDLDKWLEGFVATTPKGNDKKKRKKK
jgi:predicted DNA-binding transcriptional regulator AlpA